MSIQVRNATPAQIETSIQESLEAHTPGLELGYAERTTNFVVTSGQALAGLSVTVVGQGRPVDLEFRCRGVAHSVIGTLVETTIVDGAATIYGSARIQAWSTTDGPVAGIRSRVVLADGVSYTFTVNVSHNAAGTMTFLGSVARPIWLSVVSR